MIDKLRNSEVFENFASATWSVHEKIIRKPKFNVEMPMVSNTKNLAPLPFIYVICIHPELNPNDDYWQNSISENRNIVQQYILFEKQLHIHHNQLIKRFN